MPRVEGAVKLLALILLLADCGAPELERTALYGPDGGFRGGCTASSAWCVIDAPDGGAAVLGGP